MGEGEVDSRPRLSSSGLPQQSLNTRKKSSTVLHRVQKQSALEALIDPDSYGSGSGGKTKEKPSTSLHQTYRFQILRIKPLGLQYQLKKTRNMDPTS
jgi:hypothetical protein